MATHVALVAGAWPPQPRSAPAASAHDALANRHRHRPRAAERRVAGFGDVPLSRAPLQATRDRRRSSCTTPARAAWPTSRASTPASSDAYNAEGYWDYFTVRGFVLDNRFNYRRDGLPINAETAIPLDNKARIEMLQGHQRHAGRHQRAGRPGELVVKRPHDEPLRACAIEWRDSAARVTGALDLEPALRRRRRVRRAPQRRRRAARPDACATSRGKRQLLAGAGDWRARRRHAARSRGRDEPPVAAEPARLQPARQHGARRAPIDPRLNLNNQPWSLPVVFDGRTALAALARRGSRPTGASSRTRRRSACAPTTASRSRSAASAATARTADRYCSDGTFDLYDFRSENERRRNDAVDLAHRRPRVAWAHEHRWRAGVLWWRQQADLPPQAFNFVGTGTIDGSTVVPPDPTLAGGSARDQRNTERYLRDQWVLTPALNLWLGLRHTRIENTDSGSAAIDGVSQGVTTPWLAASWQLDAAHAGLRQLGPGHRDQRGAQPAAVRQPQPAAAGAEEPPARSSASSTMPVR